jgi:hypothetical protein
MKTIQNNECLMNICKSDKDFVLIYINSIASINSVKTNHIAKIVGQLYYLDALVICILFSTARLVLQYGTLEHAQNKCTTSAKTY